MSKTISGASLTLFRYQAIHQSFYSRYCSTKRHSIIAYRKTIDRASLTPLQYQAILHHRFSQNYRQSLPHIVTVPSDAYRKTIYVPLLTAF